MSRQKGKKQASGPDEKTETNQSSSSISTKELDEGYRQKFVLQWKDVSFRIKAQNPSYLRQAFNYICPEKLQNNEVLDDDYLRHDHQLLSNNSGYLKSGEMVAIIGPSGSGKTTLLNILGRRYTKLNMPEFNLSGSIKLNNAEMTRQAFVEMGAYLEQSDVMYEFQSPRELFRDAAQLRTNLTQTQISKKIDNLVDRLNLWECQHNLAGGVFLTGISGGERKRTALGIELITDPHLIFLDEPTSGLDSENSF